MPRPSRSSSASTSSALPSLTSSSSSLNRFMDKVPTSFDADMSFSHKNYDDESSTNYPEEDQQEQGSSSDEDCSTSRSSAELSAPPTSDSTDASFAKHTTKMSQAALDQFVLKRNFCVEMIGYTGALLSIGTYQLTKTDVEDETTSFFTQNKLPILLTSFVACAFAVVAGLVYFLAWHAQELLQNQTVQVTTPVSAAPSEPQVAATVAQEQPPAAKEDEDQEEEEDDQSMKVKDFQSMTLSRHDLSTSSINASVHNNNKASSSAVESLEEYFNSCQRESTMNTGIVSYDQAKPIAELFTDTTIMFADIEGFTAWSSVRQPTQVFSLLETLFHAFDTIAIRRNIFKVETVGDCYVAVSGLPQPRNDHAIAMARFASTCLKRMKPLCKQLEVTLGPDTSDLNIRIGLHSGPVTCGVLRGDRARLQLFGDTMNTASRIESTGLSGRIHISHETAELLESAGKGHWVSKRSTKVLAKGKGSLQTFWLSIADRNGDAKTTASDKSSKISLDISSKRSLMQYADGTSAETEVSLLPRLNVTTPKMSSSKIERLVSWNVKTLERLLKQIVARRQCLVDVNPNRKSDADESVFVNPEAREGTLLDEVKESIELPSFNYSAEAAEQALNFELDPAVSTQLHKYVRNVAALYPDNPFHNFEHASHVTMSVSKLLSRIVGPSERECGEGKDLHDHTYGITSDPLTQFACILSALIHDADHPGVPNAQLVKEQCSAAERYNNKSVAEQNSVDHCWNMLMQPEYIELRKSIYTTNAGLKRFRSLVVNSVLATDICDRDLKHLRNQKWERAFNNGGEEQEDPKKANDRKATIVIEHLIQASDVAHTMQHWNIYIKWNERLFRECYRAFKDGRAEKDPSSFWYNGEIGFYDYYIIPLAKKLKECGVFGVSSSEYLDYALRNRKEWELRGHEVVEEMIARVKEEEAEGKIRED